MLKIDKLSLNGQFVNVMKFLFFSHFHLRKVEEKEKVEKVYKIWLPM